jgi:Rap1a immunity proteins
MKRVLCASIAMSLSLWAQVSLAKVRDGNQPLQQCTATIGAHVNFCFGYIDAVVDLLLENNGFDGFNACVSSELDDPQLRNIVVKFLKDNPDLSHLGAPNLIARSLAASFPCW